MRNRLATKLQATYLLVILIFLLIAGFYLHQTLKRFYIDQRTDQLTRQARLILQQVGPPEPGHHQDALAKKLKEVAGVRVTLIGADGTVWADSDEDSTVMENHLYRPEVQQATRQARGVSIRRSATVKVDFLYVALSIREGEDLKGFVRLALPLTELNATLASVRNKFLLAFLVASVIALIIGYAFSRSITRPLGSIAQFTRQIAEGRFSKRLTVTTRDEVGQLAEQLNTMAAELELTIHLIQQEKTKVEAILKSLNDAVLVVDDGGHIISANPATAAVFGLTEAGLVGRTLIEVFRNPSLEELFQTASSKLQPARGSVSLSTPRAVELEVSVVPVEEEAEESSAPRFIIAAHDITRMQRLEKMRVDFVANVSHELRSPLTAIRGFIETLQAGAITDLPAAERFLEVMQAQADRLTRLLDDLLTLSDIELGKVTLERRDVALESVLAECFATLESKASNGSISLVASNLEEAPPVRADRDRIMQILINLVDNGIKFTPAGGTVTVSARSIQPDETRAQPVVELSVADTGIGIPKEDLPRISERFYRVDKARSRELGGTGLGLAIVKHLVLAHGGTFCIESELGKGTTVLITLPQAG